MRSSLRTTVSSVLTGASSAGEFAQNLRAFTAPIPGAFWETLRAEGLLDPRARKATVERHVGDPGLGDPEDEATEVGPLVSNGQRETVDGYVRLGVQEGARVVTGGEARGGAGQFFAPTMLADATTELKTVRPELYAEAEVFFG